MGSLTLNGATSGQLTLAPPSVAGTNTLTLPAVTDTLVGRATTDTLINKTLTSPTITGASISSMSSSVLTQPTPQASTSGTSIDFTSIPSWVKRITVAYNAVSTTGTSNYQVQLGTSSGFETTGYLANATTVASATVGYAITTGFGVIIGPAAANTYSGVITFTLVSASNNSWSAMGMGTSGSTTLHTAAGGKVLAGTLDRVRFTTVNGTDVFDAGTISITYE